MIDYFDVNIPSQFRLTRTKTMSNNRFPKLIINDFTLQNSVKDSYVNHLNLSFELNASPDLFVQISRVVINLVDVSSKFSPDLLAPHQQDILNKLRSDLQRYLIKNDY